MIFFFCLFKDCKLIATFRWALNKLLGAMCDLVESSLKDYAYTVDHITYIVIHETFKDLWGFFLFEQHLEIFPLKKPCRPCLPNLLK